MLLFYVRHGDPTYDPDMLTTLGERQAEAVAKRLAMYGIDRIFTSPSNRAQQTAKPTCELIKKEMTCLDFCDEAYAWRDFTVLLPNGARQWAFADGRTRALFASESIRCMGQRWYEHLALSAYGFQSGMERIHRETDRFLLSLGYEHDREENIYKAVSPSDERIALFAHQGFGLAFLSSLLDIPFPQFSTHFDMGHSGLSVVEFKDENGVVIPRLLTMSNDAHLYREGLPTCYQNRLFF